ncbi:hypothetical protein LXT21_17825 [Myxococcus sp. K38C18041901]|uniref:hypothetical protein n=1 Tax=Myxococcus guangdongensis TaxID=2906760 RepID=UPI0020A73905|nr:hypothetical protein [Myxococcus guangdongensis]MCP3060646.1 hypothetical protein [Myxococcus guangdongensis]
MKPSLMLGGLLVLGMSVGCGGLEMEVQAPETEATTSSELFPECQDYEGSGCPTPYFEVTCFNSNTGMPGFCVCQPDTLVFGCL